ncbi:MULTISPECIES: phosphoenolpyruvate synthase [Methanosphaera]|uniref:Phosphoenolpyruvate synthase n=3 Tax=Methanosphaera TaxID=2316 RepID=A0A328Q032_9EURY|nr:MULTISPECIES: phosphoenolpyruvate synthase [Methanosphaera]MEE0489989.1 phosphoenolpyruvate synthase [Methanosphaera stadtmanae]RAP03602.1 phosphoenolpyruvate synthase [Methanosphaera stadtmanae]RAP48384.1 MAG: phosphoenolpyruvate synthase [Methanosphaera sp. DEW79]
MNYVKVFEKLGKEDIPIAGGKGANLGELTNAGIPVPPGFVITSETYNKFITKTGIINQINDMLNGLDINDTLELQKVADDIKNLIITTDIPDDIQRVIIEAYNALCLKVDLDEVVVAIRSSATAEDLPDASFAGQQETYLNISGIDDVLENVRKCWASLFEARAIFYREENEFDHSKVLIAVVVQQMVDSEKAGVMFTVDPSTGAEEMLIEGAWGLGEGVVSGIVTPDTCRYDKINDKVKSYLVNTKKTMFTKDSKTGSTIQIDVPDDLKDKKVLEDSDIEQLVTLGRRIQKHYGAPMDTEWGVENGKVYMLQARPITTLDDIPEDTQSLDDEERVIITRGLGASPGLVSGTVKVIKELDELDKILDGDILVTTMTTPDMVPAMKRANGIVTDEGGVTCHAAIISRELGIPCVSGTGEATSVLKENTKVTIDGKKGIVYEGDFGGDKDSEESTTTQTNVSAAPLITVTDVKVNVSMAEAAKKAYATGADGVGLLRTEHMMLATGTVPYKFIDEGREDELVKVLVDNILKVVDVFYPKTVWYRTLDAPTDEFKTLEGGENEPDEANPMLGWRGIRREIDQPDILKAEFKAIKKLHEQGYTNVGVMLPLLHKPEELRQAKEIARSVGLEPHKDVDFGMMVETPAAAIIIEDFIAEGLDFISFGTNDLTQYTLALDRNNELVAKHYSEAHPAIIKLLKSVIKKCKAAGVTTSICGQAGSKPEIVEILVEAGIDSISANTDAVPTIRKIVAKVEKKIMLEAAKKALMDE